LNRGCHLCSAGRPSRWALAHILVVSSFFFFFLAWSQRSEIGCLPYFHTRCGLSANLRCRSETRRTRLTEYAARKKSPSAHHRTTLSGYIFATKAHIDNRKKNLLSSNVSSRCPHNMVNFGLLAAEIGPVVWGTPADFKGFRVLAALLHGSQVVGVSQTLRHWAPPMFGRATNATITFVIGPHASSCMMCCMIYANEDVSWLHLVSDSVIWKHIYKHKHCTHYLH